MQLCIVIALLVAPPLYNNHITLEITFDITKIFLLIPCVILYIFFLCNSYNLRQKQEKINMLFLISKGIITFGILFTSGAIFAIASFYLGAKNVTKIAMNISINEIVLAILVLFCSSIYEELLYRLYLPHALAIICQNRYYHIGCEVACIMFFGFAHSNIGLFAVCNAILCGSVLRLNIRKTHSLCCNVIVHWLYNIVNLCFYLLLKN